MFLSYYSYSAFFFSSYLVPRDLHSFPTRRSSDLVYFSTMHQRSLVLDHENDKCQPLVFWLFDMLKLSRKSCDLCDFRIVLLEYVEYFQSPLKIHHLLQYSILESLLSLKIYTVYDKCAGLSDDAPLSYGRPAAS